MSSDELRLLIGAGVLIVVHLTAPSLLRLRERVSEAAGSFAGGLAVTYVFVHLFPELDVGHELLGDRIHVLILVGFLLVYGSEYGLAVAGGTDTHQGRAYVVRLTIAALYNGLIVFTLGTQVPTSVVLACIYLLSLGLHVVSMHHGIAEHFENRQHLTQAVLIASIVVGAVMGSLFDGAEIEVDIATALLAGFMMYQVFREELAEVKRFGWLLAGAGAMLASALLAE